MAAKTLSSCRVLRRTPSKADGLQEGQEKTGLCRDFPGEEALMEKKWLPLVFRELLWASSALGGSPGKAARNELEVMVRVTQNRLHILAV